VRGLDKTRAELQGLRGASEGGAYARPASRAGLAADSPESKCHLHIDCADHTVLQVESNSTGGSMNATPWMSGTTCDAA
jgi:hypothetical protein